MSKLHPFEKFLIFFIILGLFVLTGHHASNYISSKFPPESKETMQIPMHYVNEDITLPITHPDSTLYKGNLEIGSTSDSIYVYENGKCLARIKRM